MVKFSDLVDGAIFAVRGVLFQKTLEDGPKHNAVCLENTNRCYFMPDDFYVQAQA